MTPLSTAACELVDDVCARELTAEWLRPIGHRHGSFKYLQPVWSLGCQTPDRTLCLCGQFDLIHEIDHISHDLQRGPCTRTSRDG